MTAPAKAKPSTYVSGHCGVDNHLECRGEYAGTTCRCECHATPKPDLVLVAEVDADQPPPAERAAVTAQGVGLVGSPTEEPIELDLGDALLALTNGVEGIDLAVLTFQGSDIELCDLLGQIRRERTRLAQVESILEQRTAKAMTGDLLEWPGGTAERRHGKDRKEWDNDAVIRMVREAVTTPFILDPVSGELDRTTGALIAGALDAYADTNRPAWRVTKLKALGIDPDEFCSAVPGRPTVQVHLNGGDA